MSGNSLLASEWTSLVVGEQGVSLDVVQLALVGVGQPGRGRRQLLSSIQAQHLVQPRLDGISTRIPAELTHCVESKPDCSVSWCSYHLRAFSVKGKGRGGGGVNLACKVLICHLHTNPMHRLEGTLGS